MIIVTTDEPITGDNIVANDVSNYGTDVDRHNSECLLKESYRRIEEKIIDLIPPKVETPMQIHREQDDSEYIWMKQQEDKRKWTRVDDQPAPKRLCLRREDQSLSSGSHDGKYNDGYSGQTYAKRKILCQQLRRTTLEHREEVSEYVQPKDIRSYSPPAIHIDVDRIIKQNGTVTNAYNQSGHRQDLHKFDMPVSMSIQKRHSESDLPNESTLESQDINKLSRSCSNISDLVGDDQEKYQLNTLQQNILEALYKTCYDLGKRAKCQKSPTEPHPNVVMCAEHQSPVNYRTTQEARSPPPGVDQVCDTQGTDFTSYKITHSQRENYYHYGNSHDNVVSEDNNSQSHSLRFNSMTSNFKNLSPKPSPAKAVTPVQYRSYDHHHQQVTPFTSPEGIMPSSPDRIQALQMAGNPKKIATCSSPSASPRELKTDIWQKKSDTTEFSAAEEMDNLFTRYKQSAHPNLPWAEKEFSVKELRHFIPMLILETFDLKSDPVTKKVKGIWEKAPVGWPLNVPYIDPNNGQKPIGKPKKDILLKMFMYLLNQYIGKLDKAGADVNNPSFQSTGTHSEAPLNFSASHERILQCGQHCEEDHRAIRRPDKVSPDPARGSANLSPQNPQVTEISGGHAGIDDLPQMPALIPISNLLQLPTGASAPVSSTGSKSVARDRMENGTCCVSFSRPIMYSKPVQLDNQVQGTELVMGAVKSHVSRASPLGGHECPGQTVDSNSDSKVCPLEVCHLEDGKNQQQDIVPVQVTKTSLASPTSPFRGMKARILGSCLSRESTSPQTCETACIAPGADKLPPTRTERFPCLIDTITSATSGQISSCRTVSPPSVEGSSPLQRIPSSSDDVISRPVPDAGRFCPILSMYSRIKEKVYYIHWAGWLSDCMVKLLYQILDELNGLKEAMTDNEKREEIYIESSHLFESMLDIAMLRKSFKNTHISHLKQLHDTLTTFEFPTKILCL